MPHLVLLAAAALAVAAAATAPSAAAAAAAAASTDPLTGVSCNACLLGVQKMALEQRTTGATPATCAARWVAEKCALAHAMNATGFAECSAVVTDLCKRAALLGEENRVSFGGDATPTHNVSSPLLEACTANTFCGGARPAPAVEFIWGECGGCQDIFTAGIKKAESFVCHGLTAPLAAYCAAGAPICEYVLGKACGEIVGHFVDAGACATDICFEFHACGRAARTPCVHK